MDMSTLIPTDICTGPFVLNSFVRISSMGKTCNAEHIVKEVSNALIYKSGMHKQTNNKQTRNQEKANKFTYILRALCAKLLCNERTKKQIKQTNKIKNKRKNEQMNKQANKQNIKQTK